MLSPSRIEQIDAFGALEVRKPTIDRQTTPTVTNLVTAITEGRSIRA